MKMSGAAQTFRPWCNEDLDVVPKRVEKTKEPVGGKPPKPTAHQIRDAGLIDPEDLGRLGLRQASLLDDPGDPGGNLRLGEQLGALREPNVLEDVPAAPLYRNLGADRPPIPPTCSSSHDPVRLA